MTPGDWGGGAGVGIATSLSDLGRIQAELAARQGQIWGSTIATLGQNIGNAIEQAPTRAALAQERQARALQLQALTQDQQEKAQALAEQRAGDQALAAAIADPANGGDPQKISDAVARTHPTTAAHYLTLATQHQEALDKLQTFANQQHQTAADVLGSIDDPTDDMKVKNGLALLKTKGVSPTLLDQIAQSMDTQGAPATITQLVASAPETVKAARTRAEKAAEEAAKITVVPAEGTAIQNGKVIAVGQPKTPPAKTPTEFESFQNAYAANTAGIGKQWSDLDSSQQLAGIEKFKTLSTDASALAAANRQAESIAAQIASQKRQQDFEIAKQARSEYQATVAKNYHQAQQSSDSLRAIVNAAKAGNNIAGAFQKMATTMTEIRDNNLNRLNTTELGVPAEAASLWQRIESRYNAAVSGGSKSIPDALQTDMIRFADLMEQQAKNTYQRGRTSLLKTYPGVDLPDETAPVPTGGAPGQPVQVGGFTIRVK